MVWFQDASGEQCRRRGGDAGEVLKPNCHCVDLPDAADIDPLIVVQPYPLVGGDAFTKAGSLIRRVGDDIAQLSS